MNSWALTVLLIAALPAGAPVFAGPPAPGLSWAPRPAATDSFDRPQGSDPIGATTAPELLLSRDYFKLAFADARHVFTAPARWDRRDWRTAGFIALGLVATAAVVDEPFRDAVDGDYERDPDDFLRKFEPFGTKRVTLPVYAGFYLGGLAFDDDRAQSVALDGFIAGQIANTLITANLKRVFGRSRPYQEQGAHHFNPASSDKSFPSGHATHAFTAASVIATHYDDTPWIKGVCYGLATLVAAERIEHEEHWLSDVLAGALIGTMIGSEVVRFNRAKRAERRFRIGTDGQMMSVSWGFD